MLKAEHVCSAEEQQAEFRFLCKTILLSSNVNVKSLSSTQSASAWGDREDSWGPRNIVLDGGPDPSKATCDFNVVYKCTDFLI